MHAENSDPAEDASDLTRTLGAGGQTDNVGCYNTRV